jgi:hypothetical protein
LGKKAPPPIKMGAAEEARLRGLKMKQIKGTLEEVAETPELMKAIKKELEEYDKYLKSQKPRVVKPSGTSEKAQKIRADRDAELQKEKSNSITLIDMKSFISDQLKSKFDSQKGKVEGSACWSSSDDEEPQVKIEPSNVVEDKCNAKQETGEKKLSPGILSLLGSLIDGDDMENIDNPVQESETNEQDDLAYFSDVSV